MRLMIAKDDLKLASEEVKMGLFQLELYNADFHMGMRDKPLYYPKANAIGKLYDVIMQAFEKACGELTFTDALRMKFGDEAHATEVAIGASLKTLGSKYTPKLIYCILTERIFKEYGEFETT